MKAKNTLWLVASYLDLIGDLTPRAGTATPVLYGYRMGCGNLEDATPVVTQQLAQMVGGNPDSLKEMLGSTLVTHNRVQLALNSFMSQMIGLNIETYAALLARLIQDIIIQAPPIDTPASPTDGPPLVRHPSPITVDGLRTFIRRAGGTGEFSPGQDDIIANIAQMCCTDSLQAYARYEAAHDAVLEFLQSATLVFRASAGECFRKHHLPLLKAIYHLACLYSGVTPTGVRRSCHHGISYPEGQFITDTTLAALPLPTAAMVQLCQEPTTGPLSRAGGVYLTAFTRFVDANPTK